MYSETDFEKNRHQRSQVLRLMLLCALPGLALGIAGVVFRMELVCTGGLLLCGAVLIFTGDLKLMPVLRYGRYLREITSGLTHRTAGRLVRVGDADVYENGVWLREVILNIYEDLSEDGERRFLLDGNKPAPEALIGRDVALTSHGNAVLDICALEEKPDEHA